MSEKEGKHYKKTESKKEKEYHSLRSLVPEITGVTDGDQNFDAVYKELQRIVKTFQSQEGIDKGALKIHKDFVQSFIKATKPFYQNENYRNLLTKMKNNELTIEDYNKLIEHFTEATLIGKSAKERKQFVQAVECKKEDEYFEKVENINSFIIKDMDLVDQINHYPTKLNYLDQYKDILEIALTKWRQELKNNIKADRAYERIVKKEPHLLTEEPLSDKNITPEILMKILFEILQMNQEESYLSLGNES